MDILKLISDWFSPVTENPIIQAQAILIVVICLGLIAALIFLLVTWRITKDLLAETVLLYSIFIIFFSGIIALVRNGSILVAAWMLILLLMGAITYNIYLYGVSSVPASALVIPILIAASILGFWSGIGIACLGSMIIWLFAWGESAGWHDPELPSHVSHLTFNAPALTTIFILTALITGFWSQLVGQTLANI